MKNLKSTAQRIAIIGNAGSGKSTLSQKLQKILPLPVYHLDQYFWKPNWGHPDLDEYKKIHDQLCNKEEWIMDGMNLRFLEYRIQRAEVIIFLNIPRYICFWRIFKRTIKYYGKERPDSAKKCPEKFGLIFLKLLKWVWEFKKKYPPQIMQLLNTYVKTKEIYIFKSQREVEKFLNAMQMHSRA